MGKTVDKISVVLPVFGTSYLQRLFLAVESIKLQDYPNIEIVVSEQNSSPRYETLAKKQGIKYVFSKRREDGEFNNVGRVRNAGIKKATGKYVYLSDLDIVFLRPGYLRDLHTMITKDQPAYLLSPPMKHLVVSDFEKFYIDSKKHGLKDELNKLAFKDGFTTNKNPKNEIMVIRYGYGNRKYTIPKKVFKKISRKELQLYGYGLLDFTYHPGAILVKRSYVVSVGGYCEDFLGWGYDDVDLQKKLTRKIRGNKRKNIPKIKRFEVLHLDHEKHFNIASYENNQIIFDKRWKLPFSTLIRQDKLKNKVS